MSEIQPFPDSAYDNLFFELTKLAPEEGDIVILHTRVDGEPRDQMATALRSLLSRYAPGTLLLIADEGCDIDHIPADQLASVGLMRIPRAEKEQPIDIVMTGLFTFAFVGWIALIYRLLAALFS